MGHRCDLTDLDYTGVTDGRIVCGDCSRRWTLVARFDAAVPIIDQPVSLEDAMRDAAPFLQRAAARTARLLRFPFPL
jgi:hypothetical protein